MFHQHLILKSRATRHEQRDSAYIGGTGARILFPGNALPAMIAGRYALLAEKMASSVFLCFAHKYVLTQKM